MKNHSNDVFKTIADPVHGAIELRELEAKLIDTPSFQRLRHIKQLGLASLVYPGATHSRFAHSLGVFHITSRAIRKMKDAGKLEDLDETKLRVAALLHDVGHYPYSHLVEKIAKNQQSKTQLDKNETGDGSQKFLDHEQLGRLIVTTRTDIRQILESAELDPEEIGTIICGGHDNIAYKQLLHSTLDFDRMDYLVRDSIATGVPFGRVDINYLVNCLNVEDDGKITLDEKAIPAVEQLIIGRYLMSRAVYFHKTVFGFEVLVRRILTQFADHGELRLDRSTLEETLQDNNKFMDFRDAWIERQIYEKAALEGDDELVVLCRAFRDRKRPELIKEISTIRTLNQNVDTPAYSFLRHFEKHKLKEAVEETGIAEGCWLIENSPGVRFEGCSPQLSISDAEGLMAKRKTDELVWIKHRDKSPQRLVDNGASIIHYLANHEFKVARIYVVGSDDSKIKKARQIVQDWCEE